MNYFAKYVPTNFNEMATDMWEAFCERNLNAEHVGVIYLTYVTCLVTFYIFRNNFSDKFIHFIRIFKSVLVSIISLISLKYLNLNTILSINLLHVYNIIQLCNFLEEFSKRSNGKPFDQEKNIVNKYELSNENKKDNEYECKLIGDTSKHLENIAKKILKSEQSLIENKGILKEKEIIEEIEKKEKEEEEYMKKKNNMKLKKRNNKKNANIYGIYIFALQTFYCIIFYLINGFGITFGAHRLWSHRAFKAGSFVQLLFIILNSFANQGSVIVWAKNHRLHHKYSDTKYDPHNIRYGFFYSHIGWLLYQKTKYVREKEKEIYIDDLLQNPLLVIQHKLDPYFNFFFCFIIPGIYSYYMYNSFWDGFFILGALRWIITLHATWSINSASHSFGHRPYNSDIKASNNIFTSIVALGEGCHNYHHVFPYCYAMNENFYILSINPTKYVIKFFYHLGLVWDLKTAQNICKEVRLREALKLEKRNKLLSENIKNELMKKEDTSYITELMTSFKIRCNDYINISTFRLYSLVYECKRGLLFKNAFCNNFVGSIISSFIVLPYSSEKTRKSLQKSLNEDFFKILKGPIYFDMYTFIFSVFLVLYGMVTYVFGYFYFFTFFIAPYFVFNMWLLIYVYLLNNPPFLNVDMDTKDLDISVLNYVAFQSLLEWKKNNSIYQSQKKLYKMVFFFINFIHHHLCYTHIVEFINSKIPSYRSKEMYKHFDKTLNQYNSFRNDKFMEILKQFL
ncbi:stearoyl-CoA desaturase, putative [Plasmodium malariae]|uniref:Stearoyl-CoA desaturase, putative n=1 Tax=Plasmodium malariae TaxID=5858 RepID=A0A1A8W420_PLAMA|nr:stearoyl-CoA desaturase, putative [Plasmodium malariae]